MNEMGGREEEITVVARTAPTSMAAIASAYYL
jgi:hypothetical protein